MIPKGTLGGRHDLLRLADHLVELYLRRAGKRQSNDPDGRAVDDERTDQDYRSTTLVSHELAQHWFGDYVQGATGPMFG